MTFISNLSKTVAAAAILTSVGFLGSAQAADLSAVPSGAYSVDPTHAYINFQYNHLGLSNPTLSFDDFSVDLNLDNADPTQSTVSVTIDAASIITGSSIWKDHITGGDFFDTANHPEITFQSTSVEAAGDGAYKVMGDLTIKGEVKPVALSVTINAAMNHPMSGKPVIGLDASSNLLRSEFGMGKFTPHVSDEIALNISAELVKAQ
ncbi:MAG: YceI family protein [Granulosicoccus sp.]